MTKEAEGAGLVENDRFNHSNNTGGNFCLQWSEGELEALEIVNICISAAGVLASAVAIIFILVSKGYKKFVHRLTLYLIVAVQFDGVVSILQAVPVYYTGAVVATREGLKGLCAAAGFLSNVADWLELLVICWIVLYLAVVLVFKCSANTIRRKHEICGLTVILVLPFLLNWVPFLKNLYGLSGGNCWMKPSVRNYRDYDDVGFIFLFSTFLWSFPFSLLDYTDPIRHHSNCYVQESFATRTRVASAFSSSTRSEGGATIASLPTQLLSTLDRRSNGLELYEMGGGCSNSPFGLQKIYIHCFNCTF